MTMVRGFDLIGIAGPKVDLARERIINHRAAAN